jgi:hypothetical protein
VIRSVVALLALVALVAACDEALMTGHLESVPPVHRVPADVEGAAVLVAGDPVIETTNPAHVERARRMHVPQDFRASMVAALGLAGFRVVSDPREPHDLVARLALAVSESAEGVRQVYRCGLRSASGEPVAQIDWAWPKETRVDVYDVYDFATHHVATSIALSPEVLAYVRSRRAKVSPPLSRADAGGDLDRDASTYDASPRAP